jgi:hypothetical protein
MLRADKARPRKVCSRHFQVSINQILGKLPPSSDNARNFESDSLSLVRNFQSRERCARERNKKGISPVVVVGRLRRRPERSPCSRSAERLEQNKDKVVFRFPQPQSTSNTTMQSREITPLRATAEFWLHLSREACGCVHSHMLVTIRWMRIFPCRESAKDTLRWINWGILLRGGGGERGQWYW